MSRLIALAMVLQFLSYNSTAHAQVPLSLPIWTPELPTELEQYAGVLAERGVRSIVKYTYIRPTVTGSDGCPTGFDLGRIDTFHVDEAGRLWQTEWTQRATVRHHDTIRCGTIRFERSANAFFRFEKEDTLELTGDARKGTYVYRGATGSYQFSGKDGRRVFSGDTLDFTGDRNRRIYREHARGLDCLYRCDLERDSTTFLDIAPPVPGSRPDTIVSGASRVVHSQSGAPLVGFGYDCSISPPPSFDANKVSATPRASFRLSSLVVYAYSDSLGRAVMFNLQRQNSLRGRYEFASQGPATELSLELNPSQIAHAIKLEASPTRLRFTIERGADTLMSDGFCISSTPYPTFLLRTPHDGYGVATICDGIALNLFDFSSSGCLHSTLYGGKH